MKIEADNILISVVIPVYNRANVIGNTIESFMFQNYPFWECIVVDDASNDSTVQIVQQYCQQDNRIRLVRNIRTKGAQGARNTGILEAKGDWVCIFDSDDYAYPTMLREMLVCIDEKTDIVTSYLTLIDTRSNRSEVKQWGGDGDLLNGLLDGSQYVAFNMALIRKVKLLDIGLLDENCPAYQEYDTHIRLSQISKYKAIRKPLSNYYFCTSDSISILPIRNCQGLLYIYHKHRKLWRSKHYFVFLKLTRNLFFQVNLQMKIRLIGFVPELLIFVPVSWVKKLIMK